MKDCMKKIALLFLFLDVSCFAAKTNLFGLLNFGGSVTNYLDPLDDYFISTANGILPINGVYHQGHRDYPLTNWLCVTSDSSPKVVTSILKAPRTVTAKPGQIWVGSAASYINTPEVTHWPGKTNDLFVTYPHKTTNDWPQISFTTQLIFVRRIEKADAGRVEGLDYYARCRVRLWSDCAMVKAEKTLLLSSLTNNCTLVKDSTP